LERWISSSFIKDYAVCPKIPVKAWLGWRLLKKQVTIVQQIKKQTGIAITKTVKIVTLIL
jgi:hypothetical protein